MIKSPVGVYFGRLKKPFDSFDRFRTSGLPR